MKMTGKKVWIMPYPMQQTRIQPDYTHDKHSDFFFKTTEYYKIAMFANLYINGRTKSVIPKVFEICLSIYHKIK